VTKDAEIRRIVGSDAITTFAVGKFIPETRTTNAPPMRAGLQINRPDGAITFPAAHQNAQVHINGFRKVLTAGHCEGDNGALSGYHGKLEVSRTFGAGLVNTNIDGHSVDAAVLTQQASYAGSNCVYYSDSNCPLFSAPQTPPDGGVAILSGEASGITSGTIYGRGLLAASMIATRSVIYGRRAITSTQGDSGAPITGAGESKPYYGIHRGVYSGDQSIRVFSTWFWTVFEVNSATGGSLTFADHAPASVLAPLEGRYCRLRPLFVSDYDFLYRPIHARRYHVPVAEPRHNTES